MRRLHVLVVDDHPVVLRSVHLWVERTGEFEVVGTTADPYSVGELCRTLRPDVVLCDVFMDGVDGFEVAGSLRANHPDAAVVMFSALAEPAVVVRASDLKLPFVEKTASSAELAAVLTAAHQLRSVE